MKDADSSLTGLQRALADLRDENDRLRQALGSAQASERRFRSVLETIALIAVRLDAAGRVTFCNDHLLQLTGYSRAEVLGCDWFSTFLPKESRDSIREIFAATIRTADFPATFENEIVTRPGERRLVAWHNTLFRDETGAPLDVISIGQDITDRQRAEESLRESEERFRLLFHMSPDAMVLTRLEDGLCVDVNAAFTSFTGYAAEEVQGRSSLTLELWQDPADRDRLVEELRARGFCNNFEAGFRRRDGRIVSGLMSAQVVAWKQVAHIISITKDISDRMEAEAAVRRERDFSNAALNSLPGIFYLFDRAGHFLRWNRNFETLSGYSGEEIETLSPLDLFQGPDRERIRERIAEVFARGSADAEADLVSKDGTRTPCYFTGHTFFIEEEPCLLGLGIDITERRLAEAEKQKLQAQLLHSQKMESVGRLAGGVAHDFNNMLQAILGHTELALLETDLQGPVEAHLQQVRQAAKRSTELVGQLLAFARRQTASPKVLDLNDHVAGLLKMLRRLIGENIDLAWMPGHALWKVRIDPSQVDQVLANLTVNARDAVGTGGRIAIATANAVLRAEDGEGQEGFVPGDYVRLMVSDDGCGMDPTVLARIFDPFFTTKKMGEGTGLGLATVYGIVTQNRGILRVDSEVGRGSTFRIYLPRVQEAAEADSDRHTATPPRQGTETVLVVEDDAVILELAKVFLARLGYRVVTAHKPSEALQMAEAYSGGIHLLITDVVMPEMNGRELASRLASLHPRLRCLYMSGYTADVVAHHGVLEEGIRFLQKPFALGDLAEAVRGALDG